MGSTLWCYRFGFPSDSPHRGQFASLSSPSHKHPRSASRISAGQRNGKWTQRSGKSHLHWVSSHWGWIAPSWFCMVNRMQSTMAGEETARRKTSKPPFKASPATRRFFIASSSKSKSSMGSWQCDGVWMINVKGWQSKEWNNGWWYGWSIVDWRLVKGYFMVHLWLADG